MKFANKIAYVTGASSGIGRGAALRLASEGAQVIFMGRNRADLDSAVAEGGAKCAAVEMDVSQASSVNANLPGVIEKHGTPDIVVHAAGITVLGALDELTEADWDRQMDTSDPT